MTETIRTAMHESETGTSTWLMQARGELLESKIIQDPNDRQAQGSSNDLHPSWLRLRSVRNHLHRPLMT